MAADIEDGMQVMASEPRDCKIKHTQKMPVVVTRMDNNMIVSSDTEYRIWYYHA